MISLYVLEDDEGLYYVGVTGQRIARRLATHKGTARPHHVRARHSRIRLIGTFESKREAMIAETSLIRQCRAAGCGILNVVDVYGSTKRRPLSQEHRDKLSRVTSARDRDERGRVIRSAPAKK